MQYNQPFDQPNAPNAGFANANPGAGIQGSIPPAAAIEYPQREIVNAVALGNLTPSNGDLFQLARVIRGGQLDFAFATEAPDALVATIGLGHTQIRAGLPFTLVNGNASNQTSTPRLTLNGPDGNTGALLGVSGIIVKANGSPVAVGDLSPNSVLTLRSDGVNFRLTSLVAISDLQGIPFSFIGCQYNLGLNTYSGTLKPAPASLAPDSEYLVYFGTINTGAAPLLAVNAVPAGIVYKQGGGQVQPGDVSGFLNVVAVNGSFYLTCPVASDILADVQGDPSSFVNCTAYAGNVYAGTLTPAPAAMADDGEYLVYFNTANTAAAPQLKVNGLPAGTVVKQNGGQAQPGDIGGFLNVIKVGALFYLTAPAASDLSGAGAAAVQAHVQLISGGSFGASGTFGTTGTTMWTVPASVARIRVKCWGGGGQGDRFGLTGEGVGAAGLGM